MNYSKKKRLIIEKTKMIRTFGVALENSSTVKELHLSDAISKIFPLHEFPTKTNQKENQLQLNKNICLKRILPCRSK